MTTNVRYVGRVAIVDIEGKITVGRGEVVLHRQLVELLDDGWRRILLNLAKMTYMDSCGLSELVACYRRAKEQGGMIRLFNTSERCDDLLRVTRLDEVFESYSDEEHAIASFEATVETDLYGPFHGAGGRV